MNDSAKTIAVQSTEKLIDLFAQVFAFEESSDLSIRPSLISGLGELRIEAQNSKTILPIRPRLHASRQWLSSAAATKTDPAPELIVAPHVPEPLAADLRRAGISHADLNGRLFLKVPGLLLDRAPRSGRYRSPVTAPDLFSAKTSRLARALLAHRDRRWTQEELTIRTGLSRGLVSRVLAQLVEEAHVVREGIGTRTSAARYVLSDFDRLLDAWKAADRWTARAQVRQYSVLTSDVGELATDVRELLRGKDGQLAGVFTQWFAARLRQPYTDYAVVSVYVRKGVELALKFARPVSSGGNLWLIEPIDDGVWRETQEVDGFPLASDAQIYLDLLQVGQRGPEQAEALRNWEGFAR
jgi:hypothetical protein